MGWFGRKRGASSGGAAPDSSPLERFARANGGPHLIGWDDAVPVTVPGAPAGSRVERLVGARVGPNPLGMQYEHLLVLYGPAGEVRAVITAETAAGLHDDCYFAMFADGRHTNLGAASAMRGAEGLDVFLSDAVPMAAGVLNAVAAAPEPAVPEPAAPERPAPERPVPEPAVTGLETSGPATQPVPIVPGSTPAALDADAARSRLAELRRESERIDPGRLRELGALLQTLGAPDAADRLRRAADAFDDPRELHLAGYELVDVGLADLAIPSLRRALALRPGDIDCLCELVIALEQLERYGEAVAVMAAHPDAVDRAEVLRALFANDAALSGDLDAARAMYPRLKPDGELGVLHRTTGLRLERADALAPLGRPRGDDLRGWELILNGMTVLDVADAEYEGMGGRWAMVWDNPDSFATRLTALLQVLARASRPVSVVAHGLDRDSEILAWAIGTRLGRPVVPLDGDVGSHALIVLYTWTPRATSDSERLRVTDPTATLFGYCLEWTAGAQHSPDVVGLEAQALFPVWGVGSRVVGEIGTPDARVVATPPDDRDPEVIGRELAAVRGDDEAPQRADAFALIDALRAAGAGSGLTTGARHRYYPGGPVSSMRFES